MFKSIYLQLFFLLLTGSVAAQGTESFSNTNASVGSAYTTINWTGDNGLAWAATSARNDEGQGGSLVTGMTGDYMIVRNTTGIIRCNAIGNGIGDISFKYAKAFGAAGNIPTFGLFINGTQYGSTTTASSNAAQTFTVTVALTGSFDLEIRQLTANDQGRLAVDDVQWTGNNSNPLCTEPSDQPTDLVFSATPNTITGNFTVAPNNPDAYLVVRSLNSSLSSNPIDGTTYTPGVNLGGGVVVAVTSANSFTDINLTAGIAYYYFIFSLKSEDCNGGPNYLTTTPLSDNATTAALAPCTTPAAATALNLTAANNFITGSFTASASANRYLVVISSSASLSATPANGTTYTVGQSFGGGSIVGYGTSTSFSASSLNNNSTYYVFVFAANAECTGQPFYNNTPIVNSATTTTNTTGVPVGYYTSAEGQTCQPLKTALKNISSAGYNSLSYTPGVWDAYQYTDIKPGGGNLIWDMYTDDNNPAVPETFNFVYGTNQCGNYNSEGDCYNREHSTPKSWFNDASPMYSDVHHLIPSDGYVNGIRGNLPYGEVINANYTSIDNQSKRGTGNNYGYTGSVFEPNNAFKGDIARIVLYMAARYEDQIIADNWAGNAEANVAMLGAGEAGLNVAQRRLQVYDSWYLQTMFKWHNQDPVSQKEIDRNNGVYYQSGQNNRNPFVDHPEYVFLIWQCTGLLPVNITDFTALKQSNAVLLKWFATYETNFKLFEIERSTDAVSFYKVGTVQGQNLANYSFEDKQLPNTGMVYYRLKMIDIDGVFTYSEVVPVRLNNNFSNALLYPNPTAGLLNIRFSTAISSNTQLVLTDVTGRTIMTTTVRKGALNMEVNLQPLPNGRYFIKINDDKKVIHQSVVIAK